jgi:hypothetical protein
VIASSSIEYLPFKRGRKRIRPIWHHGLSICPSTRKTHASQPVRGILNLDYSNPLHQPHTGPSRTAGSGHTHPTQCVWSERDPRTNSAARRIRRIPTPRSAHIRMVRGRLPPRRRRGDGSTGVVISSGDSPALRPAGIAPRINTLPDFPGSASYMLTPGRPSPTACVCACVRACVRACVSVVCVCACLGSVRRAAFCCLTLA